LPGTDKPSSARVGSEAAYAAVAKKFPAKTFVVSCDLAFFAARFYPYVPFGEALPVPSETIGFLQHETGPFRIAPFFPYLFPNTSEMFRLEDIRSHWGAEKRYRELMHRIDPTSLDLSTVILFNSLKFNFSDPLLAMLNVRYFVEQPDIDIIRWTIESGTTPIFPATGMLAFRSGETLRRSLKIEGDPFYAIVIPFQFQSAFGDDAFIEMELVSASGRSLARSRTDGADLRKRQRLFLAIPRSTPKGTEATLVVSSKGVYGSVASSKDAPGGEAPLAPGRVAVPLILEHEFRDGRVFRNLAELPRYFPVWQVKTMADETVMTRRDLDFSQAAYTPVPSAGLAGRIGAVAPAARIASISILPFHGGRQRVHVRSSGSFLLASSEKLTPELRVYVDGKAVEALPINLLFAGVSIPPGEHRVDFVRRIGRGWWPVSLAGLLLFLGTALAEFRQGLALRSPG